MLKYCFWLMYGTENGNGTEKSEIELINLMWN